jgi:proline dehydrogenase
VSKKGSKFSSLKHEKIDFSDTSIAFKALSNSELIKSYWLFRIIGNPWLGKWGPRLASASLRARVPVGPLIKSTIFGQFCGGESIEECEARIDQLAEHGVGTILDFASEGVHSEADFDAVAQEIMKTIDLASYKESVPFAVFKPTGVGRAALLEKKDKKLPLSDSEKSEFLRIEERFDQLCSYAYKKNVRLLVDAEESWIQGPVDSLVRKMMHRYNKDGAIVYNTMQMYRKDRLEYLKHSHADAIANDYYLGVKLVRGAYLEKEAKRARKLSYSNPIHSSKEATDQDFNLALRFAVENQDRIALCVGTHNEKSIRLLTDLMREYKIALDDPRYYFSQLLGMSENLTYNLVNSGYLVCKYVPYGKLNDLIPYLSRRAEENSAMRGQTNREAALIKDEMQRRKIC